ncbi:MAG: divergent polysaccharide deacetylase family protein [bacterium]
MQFRFNKIDWRALSKDKQLTLNIGLAVVLIMFFAFFLDIVFSIHRFKHYVERPAKEEIRQKRKEKAGVPKKVIARVAIILDDAGGKIVDYNGLYSIKERLTVSVMPNLPTSGSVAKALADAGFEVMLHLPMESLNGNYRRLGGNMVTCSAGAYEIKRTVFDGLSSVKQAVGFNNHMGSKATADKRVMTDVFNATKGMGLYFIDSRTSDKSVAFKLAKNFGIPSAENDLFLDGESSLSYIESKFKRLILMAKRKGSAIGIGHVTRPATIAVLKELMPKYEKDGIKFVYASELVK